MRLQLCRAGVIRSRVYSHSLGSLKRRCIVDMVSAWYGLYACFTFSFALSLKSFADCTKLDKSKSRLRFAL